MGSTPLLWAAHKGHDTLVKCLWGTSRTELRDRNGRTHLHLAAVADVGHTLRGSETVVGLQLEKGTSIEARDHGGATPLQYAARGGHEAVVKILLEKGADIETRDQSREATPLCYAAEQGNEAVVWTGRHELMCKA